MSNLSLIEVKSKAVKAKDRVPIFREDLIIINKEVWEKAQKRWQELKGTWPVSKKRKAFYQQKSYIHTSPTYLFSGLMKCNVYGGTIVLISGKGTDYYGCYNARRKTCNNMLLIPRKRLDERYQSSGTVPVALMVRIGINGGVVVDARRTLQPLETNLLIKLYRKRSMVWGL